MSLRSLTEFIEIILQAIIIYWDENKKVKPN